MTATELYALYEQHPTITTDSRQCPEGSIFFALKGASFNGNRFAQAALDKGCAYAVVDETEGLNTADERFIVVDDVLTAFKELAREHRRKFQIPVIGITGTNGKTTTKELIAAVLGEKYRVMFTQGNFNNDVGVPKTLLRLTPDDEIAVVEMGASHPGDIRVLVDYVEPTCGLITNVGRAHLQGFGSFDGVKATKGELYDHLSAHNSLLFLNEANDDLTSMAAQRNFTRIVSYGQGEGFGVAGHVVACSPFLRFAFTQRIDPSLPADQEYEVGSQMIGAYNIDNMLAAIAVGLHFGVSVPQIIHALESYAPSNNRSQLTTTPHNHLIVDAYNANPSSMTAAIANFKLMDVARKMAILGDMRELGETSQQEHRAIVDQLLATDIATIWLVGSEFAAVLTAQEQAAGRIRTFADVAQVKAAIAEKQPQQHYILIKGSNSTKLFELPELL